MNPNGEAEAPQLYTAKVNIRALEEKRRKEKERQAQQAMSKIKPINAPPSRPRKRKGLNFHEPGTFIAKAEQLRKKAKLEALQKRIAASAAKTGIADAAKLASLTTNKVIDKTTTTSVKDKHQIIEDDEEVPDVEWWDLPLLGGKPMDQIVARLVQPNARPQEIFSGITNLIEHPPIKLPPQEKPPAQLPIFFTASEKKKLRKQNRKNRELEKQEKIKLGLMPKPEPKLKRSNIMYALGDEAITNPSKAEQMVRDQEEKRLQAHLEHNQSKKLDLKDKILKKARKNEKDIEENGLRVSIYGISNPKSKFIIKEARLQRPPLTGLLVLYKQINLVLAEGSPKQQKEFMKFMLRSANQKKDVDPMAMDIDGPQSDTNGCYLIWEGKVTERCFEIFKRIEVKNEAEARSYFKNAKVEHYWDLAIKKSILDSIEDN